MSTYVEQTLASDESIIHRANFNWTYSFGPVVLFALGASALVYVAAIQLYTEATVSRLVVAWWCAGIGAAAGAAILISHLVKLWTTEIVVTTYRFVYKRGLISRSTQEVSLNKIEEITLQQSIWGRIFGYGRLIMRGTGVGIIELPNLDRPLEVRKIIENARAALRRGSPEERSGEAD